MISEPCFQSLPVHASDDQQDAIYVRRLLDFQGCLRLSDLPAALGSKAICRLEGLGDGLTTLAFHSDDVDQDIIDTIMNFRLAQFLKVGLMSASLARRRNLLREPVNGLENTIHAITLDAEGRIYGYLALVGSSIHRGKMLDDPARPRLPVEEAHHVELLSSFANPGLTIGDAWELKRFVRASQTPTGAVRDRVPWHLIVSVGRVVLARTDIQIMVGDSKPEGALKHLSLAGFDPLVYPDTLPSLSHDHLMWPSYEQASVAQPFVTLIPEYLDSFVNLIALHLRDGGRQGWQRELVLKLQALRRSEPRLLAIREGEGTVSRG